MLPSFDLPSAIQACEEAIRLNDAAHVDRIGRRLLDNLSDKLRSIIRQCQDELARGGCGNAHLFSANWKGPALADVLASSAFHRTHSAERKVA